MYRLLIGADRSAPDYEFLPHDYHTGSISMITAVDVVGSELSIDELTVVVDYEVGLYTLFAPSDYDGIMSSDGYLLAGSDQTPDLSTVPFGTPVWVVDDLDNVYVKMYFVNSTRVGRSSFKLKAMSAVGFLDRGRHYGGLYYGITAGDLISELIADRFAYTVDQAVAGQLVSGWLPIDTPRNNLHRIMFALGINLIKDTDGNLRFAFVADDPDCPVLPASRMFRDARLEYSDPVTELDVAEHSYYKLPDTEAKRLYTNADAETVTDQLIEFSAPVYDLYTEDDLSIVESGVNYAVVSGKGTLYGREYHHEIRTIVKSILSSAGQKPNIVVSDKDALVNALNVENVAQRLEAYYTNRKTTSLSIKTLSEKPGDVVAFTDVMGDPARGFISRAQTVLTSWPKSTIEIIHGYVPTGQGNYYSEKILVTESGTVQIPVGVTRIRIILVGGGDGGQGGKSGEDGRGYEDLTHIQTEDAVGWVYAGGNQAVSHGGAAGEAGLSGKLLVFDLDVTAGDVLNFAIGVGGSGGAVDGGAGDPGTDTSVTGTFGSASSADGYRAPYMDPFSGSVLCAPGEAGHPGGDGGQTDTFSLSAYAGGAGLPGGDVGQNIGGVGGEGIQIRVEPGVSPNATASGGGGGGAAYGADGGDGGAGYNNSPTSAARRMVGGYGGDGADAVKPATGTYGSGGGGGNGGGGGGNGGGCRVDDPDSVVDSVTPGNGGQHGSGSTGGDGADGCALIYYKRG